MAIYLDANILVSWANFAAAERLALTIVARDLRQHIVVPELALEEAAERHRRILTDHVSAYENARKAINAFFDRSAVPDDPVPAIDAIVEDWKTSVAGSMAILPISEVAAREGLLREVRRHPPARQVGDGTKDPRATGARDAAIWLDIVAHHKASSEPGYLISKNKDFVSGGNLRSVLSAELEGSSSFPPLRAYLSVFAFLDLGAVNTEYTLTREALEERAVLSLQVLLPLTEALPRAIFGPRATHLDYGTKVTEMELLSIRSFRRYEKDSDAVTVADTI